MEEHLDSYLPHRLRLLFQTHHLEVEVAVSGDKENPSRSPAHTLINPKRKPPSPVAARGLPHPRTAWLPPPPPSGTLAHPCTIHHSSLMHPPRMAPRAAALFICDLFCILLVLLPPPPLPLPLPRSSDDPLTPCM